MPIDPSRLCKCHGLPMYRASRQRYCHVKFKASSRAYAQSPKGKAVSKAYDQLRIRVGRAYLGQAKTVEQAEQIKAHIAQRIYEFKQRQQARTETEGISSGAVRA